MIDDTNASFINCVTFAEVSGVTRQFSHRLLRNFTCGRLTAWRGATLSVRVIHGKGGASGKQYEVAVASLPADIQERLKALQSPLTVPSKPVGGDNAGIEWAWKYDLIQEALNTKPKSIERGNALDLLSGKTFRDWRGQMITTSRRTIERWIKKYETQQTLSALGRQARADNGKSRVILSARWDSAVPFKLEIKEQIAEMVRQHIRAHLVKQPEDRLNIRIIRHDTSIVLADLTAKFGFIPNVKGELERICTIPDGLIYRKKSFAKAGRHYRNRKASADDKPRIVRLLPERPMERVVVDVHKVNVLVEHEGKTATPHLIAFLDVATGRVWGELYWYKNGGSVRNIDMIGTLIRKFTSHEWGMAELYQFDNGKENLFADLLENALALRSHTWIDGQIQAVKRVVRAQPYNAAAKEIEGWFGRFERTFLSSVLGYIGDDRMKPKQVQLGKLPAAFQGFDAFCEVFDGLLAASNALPQGGRYGGSSLNKTMQKHIDNGWSATVMLPEDAIHAFTIPIVKPLRGHKFKHEKRDWISNDLLKCFDDTVVVHVPKWFGYDALYVETIHGKPIGIVYPDAIFAHDDPRGALRSSDMNRIRNKTISDMKKSVPDLDILSRTLAIGANAQPIRPNKPDAIIRFNRPKHPHLALVPSQPAETISNDEYDVGLDPAEWEKLLEDYDKAERVK